MRHTISILVENKFGVLARIAGMFSGRGFNIDTLNVGPTLDATASRMTIVVRGDDKVLEQVTKQLEKLVDVIDVQDFRDEEYVDRELVLLRVTATSKTRSEVMQICDIFRAKIIDVQPETLAIEVTGTDSKMKKFLMLMDRFGIKELDPHRKGRAPAHKRLTFARNPTMPAKIYTDKDADLAVLKGKTLAVLGFGSQGHAHALNLKDSGCKVIIGLYPGSKSRKVAEDYGFAVHDTAEAVKLADVIMVGIPDTKQAAAYKKDIGPNLAKGKTLLFTHGFSIHFKTVVPPKDVNVIMVAPKGPGHIVRRQFTEGKGVPALIAVYQDPGKDAKKDRPRLGQGHWRHARRRDSDDFQGGNRNRSVRRADRSLRRSLRARSGRIRDARRSRLFPRDGLLRMSSRIEAHRRSYE